MLSQYLLDRSTDNPALKAHLSQLLAPQAPHVGLIVSERLINMPVQVMPPMYRMLSEEMQRAISEVCLAVSKKRNWSDCVAE
jgi:protein BCP1